MRSPLSQRMGALQTLPSTPLAYIWRRLRLSRATLSARGVTTVLPTQLRHGGCECGYPTAL